MLSDLLQDLRFGARNLARHRGFTILVVLTLALGLGANTAVFSVLNALVLRPLPIPQPERLVFLNDGLGSGRVAGLAVRNGRMRAFSHPLYRGLRDAPGFQGLAAEDSAAALAQVGREPGQARAARAKAVSGNYFDVLGLRPFRGRLLQPADETAAGADPVVVISHGFWQQLGGTTDLIGGRLLVDGRSYTVAGIAPPGFTGTKVGEAVDLWAPITMQGVLHREDSLLAGHRSWLSVFGRLRAHARVAEAEASLNRSLRQQLSDQRAQMRPADQRLIDRGTVHIQLQPGATGVSVVRRDFQPALLALMAGVGLLLLIVCLNVSHLLVARALQRRREMSIRTALGASRWRLIRQLATESALLSVLGIAAGALSARWLIDALLAGALGVETAAALAVAADARVWTFTAALGLVTTALMGLAPVWQLSFTDVQRDLRATTQSVIGAGPRRLMSRMLLTTQVALSMVLLVAAGLLSGSLRSLRHVDKGFDEDRVLLAGLDLRFVSVPVPALHQDLLDRLSRLPGVDSVSLTSYEILDPGRWRTGVSFEATTAPIAPNPNLFVVSPAYFATVGIARAAGRDFGSSDGEGAAPVAIVNQTLAHQLAAGPAIADVVGRRFLIGDPQSPERANIQVVGIVRDARVDGLREPPRPSIYLPLAQWPGEDVRALQLRTRADPAALAVTLQRALTKAHPSLRLQAFTTMSRAVDGSLRHERVLATLASFFGLVAVLLVCVGLYGLISQWATQRTQEIGLRLALGVSAAGVRWLVLRQAFALVAAGLALGVPAALIAAHALRGLLYGVTPFDPRTVILAGLVLVLVATLAAYLPARRASRADPMIALR